MFGFAPALAQGLSRVGFGLARTPGHWKGTQYVNPKLNYFSSKPLREFGSGIIPSGKFGFGYVTGTYLTYGLWNQALDPFGINKPKYKRPVKQSLKMPFMSYRRYGYRRFRRYRRYGRFRRYRRRSYYRRRYY